MAAVATPCLEDEMIVTIVIVTALATALATVPATVLATVPVIAVMARATALRLSVEDMNAIVKTAVTATENATGATPVISRAGELLAALPVAVTVMSKVESVTVMAARRVIENASARLMQICAARVGVLRLELL